MGELLEKVIRKKGLNISELAKAIGVHRRSFYNWFKEPQIKVEVMEKIAEAINHDFSGDIVVTTVKSKELIIRDHIVKDDEYWKNKYIDLLERYAELADKQIDC